jgi:hypothetical protein
LQPLLGLLMRGGGGDVNVHVACVEDSSLEEGPMVWRNLHPRCQARVSTRRMLLKLCFA